MHTIRFLTHLVEHHQALTYGMIYLGLVFEGELFLICAGILTHLGALNFFLTVFFVLLGAISKTLFGYALGEFLFARFNHHKIMKYLRRHVYKILPKFRSRPFWSIFISKFIMGANNVVIVFSGFEKINFKKFLQAEISAIIIWVPLLLTLGYFFSYTALRISHNIWKFLIVILVLFIIFVMFDKLVSKIYEYLEEFDDDNN